MLRSRDEPEGGEAAAVLGLMSTRAPRLVLTGRPVCRGVHGMLAVGEPVDVETVAGRIAEVRPSRAGARVPGLGGRRAVLAPGLSDSHVHLVAAATARANL